MTSEEFVENALYHSACITRYLLRNTKTEIEEPPMSEHENAFDQFVSTIQEDLLIHKKVFYLNHPLEKFVPFLPEDMRESYTTYRLQQKLEKRFGDAFVIQCQQGQDMSNIVYNSSIVSLKLSTRPTVWRLIWCLSEPMILAILLHLFVMKVWYLTKLSAFYVSILAI